MKDFEEFFNRLCRAESPEYFLAADLEELREQPELVALLNRRFGSPLSGEGYFIWTLRENNRHE